MMISVRHCFVERHVHRSAVTLLSLLCATGALAQNQAARPTAHLKVLADNLTNPLGAIVVDAAGDIFGTLPEELKPFYGAIYRLTPPAQGQSTYTYTQLWSFVDHSIVGVNPIGGLIADQAGTLYGTTLYNGGEQSSGCGSVYSLPESGSGTAPQSLYHPGLHKPQNLCVFYAAPALGSDGALYGTTENGGVAYGGIYRLAPPRSGQTKWRPEVLYRFRGLDDGYYPDQPLLVSASGALYGTAIESSNGADSAKVPIYKLSPPAAGQTAWRFELIWRFNPADCAGEAVGKLVEDASGTIYGACSDNVTKIGNTPGTVFQLTPPASGQTQWHEAILWRFDGKPDGHPNNGVVMDAQGNLFGTTSQGDGTIFELMPPASGQTAWTERTLWVFNGAPGVLPSSPLVIGPDGGLFGTTARGGGPHGYGGLAYELTP